MGKEHLPWNERGGGQHTNSYTRSNQPSKGRTMPMPMGPAVETIPDDKDFAFVFPLIILSFALLH